MNKKKSPAYLSIRVEGPAILPGRMKLSDFIQLSQELMKAVERVAIVLQSSKDSSRRGRRPEELKKAVSLDLIGFTQGSPAAVAHLERSDPQTIIEEVDIGNQAFTTFFDGLNQVTGEKEALPVGYDLGVLLKVRDIGKAFSRGVNEITFSLNHRERPVRSTYRAEGLERVRHRIERPEAQEITIQGRLLMADFKESGPQIRIHPSAGEPVVCRFDGALSDEVEESIRAYVKVRGRASYNEHGDITSLKLSDLERLDAQGEGDASSEQSLSFGTFWEHKTVEQLAEEQGVMPASNLDAIFGGWPGDVDDGFEEWIDGMRCSQPIL